MKGYETVETYPRETTLLVAGSFVQTGPVLGVSLQRYMFLCHNLADELLNPLLGDFRSPKPYSVMEILSHVVEN